MFYVLLRGLTGNRPLKQHGEVPHLEAFAGAEHVELPAEDPHSRHAKANAAKVDAMN